MYNSSTPGQEKKDTLTEWAVNHKTIIVLNGGYQSNLENINTFLLEHHNTKYPSAWFREEYEALNTALTCVGIILDDTVYESPVRTIKGVTSDQVTPDNWYDILKWNMTDTPFVLLKDFDYWRVKMALMLNEYKLA